MYFLLQYRRTGEGNGEEWINQVIHNIDALLRQGEACVVVEIEKNRLTRNGLKIIRERDRIQCR